MGSEAAIMDARNRHVGGCGTWARTSAATRLEMRTADRDSFVWMHPMQHQRDRKSDSEPHTPSDLLHDRTLVNK
jgi:hypothetical protein